MTWRLPSTRSFDTSAEVLRDARIGDRDRQPRAGDRGGGGREAALVEAAEQLPAALVALEAAPAFAVDIGGKPIAARGQQRSAPPPRTARWPDSTCWVSCTPGAVDLRLRDRGGEHGRDRERREHLPAHVGQPAPRARAGACARRSPPRSRGRGGRTAAIAAATAPGSASARPLGARCGRHRGRSRRAPCAVVAAGGSGCPPWPGFAASASLCAAGAFGIRRTTIATCSRYSTADHR